MVKVDFFDKSNDWCCINILKNLFERATGEVLFTKKPNTATKTITTETRWKCRHNQHTFSFALRLATNSLFSSSSCLHSSFSDFDFRSAFSVDCSRQTRQHVDIFTVHNATINRREVEFIRLALITEFLINYSPKINQNWSIDFRSQSERQRKL